MYGVNADAVTRTVPSRVQVATAIVVVAERREHAGNALARSMFAAFFLIFLPAMREVTTSILLYGPYTHTLGVQIYSLRDAGMIPQAAALATVAIGIIIILNTIVTKVTKDRKGV